MKILIVKPTGESVDAYLKKLDKWGIQYDVISYPDLDSRGILDEDFRIAFAEKMQVIYQGTIDAIQFFSRKWKNPPRRLIRGIMFNKYYSGYLISYTRLRKGYENTGIHELLHKVDNWVLTYLGIKLETVVGVEDWDEGVVHGKETGYKEYEYDDVWEKVKPHVLKALAYKNNKPLLDTLNRLIIAYREQLQQLKATTVTIEDMEHPFKNFPITQKYGVANALYKITGVHTGTDYGTPVGTPVKAPIAGEIIEAGYTKTRGNYCHFKILYAGQTLVFEFLHLKTIPKKGKYNKGQVMAYTGNTGLSTGPHCHVTCWNNSVRIDYINKANWKDLTEDPEAIFTA